MQNEHEVLKNYVQFASRNIKAFRESQDMISKQNIRRLIRDTQNLSMTTEDESIKSGASDLTNALRNSLI